MPNWCYNNLEVHGEVSELQRLVDATKTTHKDEETGETEEIVGLNHLFPCPEELSNTVSGWLGDGEEQKKLEKQQKANIKKYGHKDWYDWCCANWGTKWGASDFDWTSSFDKNDKVEVDAKYINAYFQSAWSPAEGLVKEISKQFPTLVFSIVYTEESDAVVGCSVFRDGNLLGEEGEDSEMPKEIQELFTNGNEDEAFEKANDWRNDVQETYEVMRDHLVAKALSV